MKKSPRTMTLRRLPQLSPLTVSILNETIAGSCAADKALEDVAAWLAQAQQVNREAKTRHVADAEEGGVLVSTGQRVNLADAQRLAAWLFDRWALDAKTCFVVGSVRRQRDTVGDIEIIAPARDKKDDPEFERISATMDGTVSRSMFDAPAAQSIGRAIKGLKPGFLAADLEIDTRTAGAFPVQVYRYGPDNFGWIMLMRTGPADFGEWFLGRWKDAHGISRGDPRFRGSIDGHLVDASCKVVPVRTEDEAFAKIGVKFVPPERRSAFVEHIKAGRVA